MRPGDFPASIGRREALRLLTAVPLVAAGCGGPGPPPLVIATDWPEAERRALATLLAAGPIRFRFLTPAPGADLFDLIVRGLRADLVLGGPPSRIRELADRGYLFEGRWRTALRSPMGLAVSPTLPEGAPIDLLELPERARPALADPRIDPETFVALRSVLLDGDWPPAYAWALRLAARSAPIRRARGAGLAAVARGAADFTLASEFATAGVEGLRFVPAPELGIREDGVAVLAHAADPARALEFVEMIAENAGSAANRVEDLDARGFKRGVDSQFGLLFDRLLSDLLGAALVEARPELRRAVEALDALGGGNKVRLSDAPNAVGRAWTFLVQPPPWPPASIRELGRDDPEGTLRAGLARELAPDPEARAALSMSWERPEAPIDRELLASLANAAGGRLASEPRFRAWLASEWAAWCRQRARRVARLAAGGGSPRW